MIFARHYLIPPNSKSFDVSMFYRLLHEYNFTSQVSEYLNEVLWRMYDQNIIA